MGVIQQGFNQLLGTAAIAAKLNPELEKQQELRNLSKKEEVLKARRDAAVESVQKRSEEDNLDLNQMQQDVDILQETATEVEALRKRQFELDPSPASYEKYHKSKGKVKEAAEIQEELRGQIRAQEKATAQLQQKEDFNKFREQISSDIQDTINIMKGKDVPTQAEIQLDEKLRKMDPSFDKLSESAKQIIREKFKGGGNK